MYRAVMRLSGPSDVFVEPMRIDTHRRTLLTAAAACTQVAVPDGSPVYGNKGIRLCLVLLVILHRNRQFYYEMELKPYRK